jgi:hypothetical protein
MFEGWICSFLLLLVGPWHYKKHLVILNCFLILYSTPGPGSNQLFSFLLGRCFQPHYSSEKKADFLVVNLSWCPSFNSDKKTFVNKFFTRKVRSLEQCDLLVTTGGVSMGDRDLLRYRASLYRVSVPKSLIFLVGGFGS